MWCWIHADTWITAAGRVATLAFGPSQLLAQRHFNLCATSVLACTTLMIDRGASNYRIIKAGMKNSGTLHIKQQIEETVLATTCWQFHCSSDSSETIMPMHNFWLKKIKRRCACRFLFLWKCSILHMNLTWEASSAPKQKECGEFQKRPYHAAIKLWSSFYPTYKYL